MNPRRDKRIDNIRTGPGLRAWPVHVLLLVAVLAPLLFALWSIREAITNERLAVRQKLINAYESQLHSLSRSFEASWKQRLQRIDTLANSLSAQEAFARLVKDGLLESVIVHRDSEGYAYPNSGDGEGRNSELNSMLLDIENRDNLSDTSVVPIADKLAQSLNDYTSIKLVSSQRLFLMRRLDEYIPDRYAFPTVNAEVLAARSNEAGLLDTTGNTLTPSSIEDIWQVTLPENRLTALFSTDFLQNVFQSFTPEYISLQDIEVVWQKPGELSNPQHFVSVSAGDLFPDWRLVLNLEDDSVLTSTMEQRIALYTALGAVMITASILLSLWIARMIQRNINLARLKDNLVATVSHELKTPVASVRVLVDTLLDKSESDLDEKQTREYLELISRENMRLSHVVDNFLAFSRMERGKHRFVLEPSNARIIAQESAQTFRDRYELQSEEFTLEISDDLPEIMADAEVLKTALINLLENAFKYSGNPHRIRLGVTSENDSLTFSVQDNGIGIRPRDKQKIFDRFYRANQKLTRSAGGVGLGLSIVQFIVAEHNGQLSVKSEPDVGSTFSIVLPLKNHSMPSEC